MAEASEEDQITEVFTEWNAKKLSDYFGEATTNLVNFSHKFNMICLTQISLENPAHLFNDAMNDCLSEYHE